MNIVCPRFVYEVSDKTLAHSDMIGFRAADYGMKIE